MSEGLARDRLAHATDCLPLVSGRFRIEKSRAGLRRPRTNVLVNDVVRCVLDEDLRIDPDIDV